MIIAYVWDGSGEIWGRRGNVGRCTRVNIQVQRRISGVVVVVKSLCQICMNWLATTCKCGEVRALTGIMAIFPTKLIVRWSATTSPATWTITASSSIWIPRLDDPEKWDGWALKATAGRDEPWIDFRNSLCPSAWERRSETWVLA